MFPDSISVAPVRKEYGAVVGGTAIHRDVAEQRKASGRPTAWAAIIEQTMGADQMHV